MNRSLTAKGAASVGLAAVFVFGGLALGRVELIALAAPFLVSLLWGLAASADPTIGARFEPDDDRCTEGDLVKLIVTLKTHAAVDEVAVGLALPPELALAENRPATTIVMDSSAPWTHTFGLLPRRWGVYPVGPLYVRALGPGRNLVYERTFDPGITLRAYPQGEPLRRGIAPPRTQVFAGNYVSRNAGEGIEFANVREFSATDDVKRINWRVTSRRGSLYLNEFHPERNADVILFLDTFEDVGPAGSTSLDLTARGAAALARHYLARKDRVGLVNFGGFLGWIKAGQGHAHTHRVIEYVLGVQATWSYAWKDLDFLPVGVLPPQCTVIAFSPLLDKRAVAALGDVNARGFPLVIIDTLRQEGVEPADSPEGRLAWRVWKMRRAEIDLELERLGIPVVTWPEGIPFEAALARVPALRRRTIPRPA